MVIAPSRTEGGGRHEEDSENDPWRKAVVITDSDCYEQTFALAELAPTLGGTSQVIVAHTVDGELLGDEGMARIIAPGDTSGARNVSNIVRIKAVNP